MNVNTWWSARKIIICVDTIKFEIARQINFLEWRHR